MDVYGLVGDPVGHSLSPPMHEAAYDAVGMDARYVTFEPDDAAAAVAGAADLGVAGLNVTVPFKEAALDAVDPDPVAARVGAVNTVDFSTDPPTGTNTDVAGVERAFTHHDVDPAGATAVVVGAGGAARAAAFALAEPTAALHVANRTAERAEALAADVRESVGGEVTAGGLDSLAESVPDADLLVNATSVGMETDETPVPADLLHADLAVLDAVYAPLDTRLLREARAAGATTVDGAWMLLYQGAEAFERWTGEEAPVAAMNRALRAELG
ncbi:shikimate dehydrogenase [Candidatus Halobonum tyrrellensis]|uniref:Shikimate dehydrogenase (NADP(+)) n=1 Tax=Candidatus Halobonum tyrrellensis G22 TaxID=1324957 RepID=V4GXN3_9EURY|nr:shikimate dehydrogenase [Candidatus Halobonum tyrrellensis]ESP89916.1 shikimate 5-dehydrogenase [Candidatus Halobonum tyrrellensis G22]